MAAMVPGCGSQTSLSDPKKNGELNSAGDQEEAASQDVTRYITMKPPHSTQGLEKEVVLRRIRQRKRANKFRAVVGALFSSPFTDKTGESRQRKWVDEPFAALCRESSLFSQKILSKQLHFLALPHCYIYVNAEAKCEKSCSPNHRPQDFPYPFGFSDGCIIRLNCSHDGFPLIGEFQVDSVNSEHIKVVMRTKCNRRLDTIRHFFSRHYAPTSHNAILLQNCSAPVSTCLLPTTPVETKFESPNCSVNGSSISCYTQNTSTSDFMDLDSLTGTHCDYLLSSISAESLNSSAGISLEIQTLELGWWLEGDCQSCHEDANCTKLTSPSNGRPSHRCQCRDGLLGDGYVAGTGCRKASSNCYTMQYIYGECGRTKIAILIGGIVGGGAVLVGVGLFCCFCRRRSNQKAVNFTRRRLSEATGKCTIHVYAYKEIEKATNNFSEQQRLGTGAFGTVYAGKLRSDDWVAIKRLKNQDTDSIEHVINEIKLISSVDHPNLVRLLGCSLEDGEQILVYEFMANGTLCQHLQRERGEGLAWPVRLDIAVETAQAIAHLHSTISPPIFHRDIKSSNILLDHNFNSKVADFGLSRLGMAEISHISTAPQGTPGYLDPQYHQDYHLSDKSDVYSFGVVLVEMMTAMKVVDFCRSKNEVNLATLATDRIGNGRLNEIIDPFIEAEKDAWTVSSLQKVAELAFRCLAFHRDMRPSMVEVATELEDIRRTRWASFFSDSSQKLSMGKQGFQCKGVLFVETGSSKSSHGGDHFSPVSVEDSWISEQSSPSSSSLLNNVIL